MTSTPVLSGKSSMGVLPVLLCFSHLRWNFVYQRPQHLLSRAARDYEVYFFEEPIFEGTGEARLELSEQPEGITVATPILPQGMEEAKILRAQRKLVDDLVAQLGKRPRLCWYYTPMMLPFTKHIDAALRVYDNMDELSAFHGAPPRLLQLERELFAHVDIVFTGGHSLYEAKRSRHANVHAFPSSIDAAHFLKARRPRPQMPDQASIGRPKLGFFGVIDERMDLQLVGAAAELRPEWQFMMIGPVVKIDPAILPRRPNIHWLGAKSYQELPVYLSDWDVGIMPFALNDSTRYISPTKTPEFLAAGVPTVSTGITDVIRPYGDMGLVEIASTAEELVQKAQLLVERAKGPWLAEVDRYLSTISWDLTWNDMQRLMLKAMDKPEQDIVTTKASNAEMGGARV
ncbi:MAG TPA: glycosyltransferase family 1 protein [Burkholderiales bacterium]|nr:glycosyltransferase family 1 protein [Burkholderiales bacterium]